MSITAKTTSRPVTSPSNLGNQKPVAVIIGLDSMQGLQAARILARHGVPVIGISDDPSHPGCRTNVCQQIIHGPTATEGLIEILEDSSSQLNQKAVLFPCEDTSVSIVSRHRRRLEPSYHVQLPAPQTVEMLMDKVSFSNFAEENGLPIPRTRVVKDRAAMEQVANELTFPCVIKPRDSAALEWEHKTVFKAFKIQDAGELLAVHSQYERYTDCFIVQEWINGNDSDLYSCNCYFDANSEPLVTFVARKLRQWPPETGISSLGEECHNDIVLEETLRLFRRVRYQGLGYLEMKYDRQRGKHYIVEPNIGRPTGRSAITEAGGVELLYTMYCDALGWPLPMNREQRYTGVKWIYLRKDLQSSIHYWRRGELTFRDWWRSLRGRKTFALGDWKDPAPFVHDWIYAVRSWLSPVKRKRRTLHKAATAATANHMPATVSR